MCLSLFGVCSVGSSAGYSARLTLAAAEKERPAAEPWQQKWNKILAEARKEGKAVAYGNFSANERTALSKGIKAKYGIEMEWVTGNSSQVISKLTTERTAGLYISVYSRCI